MIPKKAIEWAMRVGPKAFAFSLPVMMALMFVVTSATATNYYDDNWNTSEQSVIDGVSFILAIIPYAIQLLILVGIVIILIKVFSAGKDGVDKLRK